MDQSHFHRNHLPKAHHHMRMLRCHRRGNRSYLGCFYRRSRNRSGYLGLAAVPSVPADLHLRSVALLLVSYPSNLEEHK